MKLKMNKELPLWIKYGLVTSFFAFLVNLIPLMLFEFKISFSLLPRLVNQIIFVVGYLFLNTIMFNLPLWAIGKILPFSKDFLYTTYSFESYFSQTFLGGVIGILIWFAIGALIGWLIKRRREKVRKK